MNKRTLFFSLILLAAVQQNIAQTHCDGTRYIEPVFEQVDSTIGIVFGQNTTMAGAPKTLRMDVYTPPSEFFFARPLVILAFGGSFLVGDRKQLRQLCIELASRGFVAATIDYRLFDAFALPLDSLLAMDVAIKATGDLKAAIRWFKESAAGANEFGIDSSNIFSGGVSAGAIAALHAAYLDTNDYLQGSYIDSIISINGGIKGSSSTNLSYSDRVKGVVNFSGAIKDARWIDAGEPTIVSIHDEFDDVVPYGRAISTAIGTPVELWGSFEINKAAEEVGIRSDLFTIENSTGHVSYFVQSTSPNYEPAVLRAVSFLEYTVCDRVASVRQLATVGTLSLYPNPAIDRIGISCPFKIESLKVLSNLGHTVLSFEGDNLDSIDISDLPTGLYTIQVVDANGLAYAQKFIK